MPAPTTLSRKSLVVEPPLPHRGTPRLGRSPSSPSSVAEALLRLNSGDPVVLPLSQSRVRVRGEQPRLLVPSHPPSFAPCFARCHVSRALLHGTSSPASAPTPASHVRGSVVFRASRRIDSSCCTPCVFFVSSGSSSSPPPLSSVAGVASVVDRCHEMHACMRVSVVHPSVSSTATLVIGDNSGKATVVPASNAGKPLLPLFPLSLSALCVADPWDRLVSSGVKSNM